MLCSGMTWNAAHSVCMEDILMSSKTYFVYLNRYTYVSPIRFERFFFSKRENWTPLMLSMLQSHIKFRTEATEKMSRRTSVGTYLYVMMQSQASRRPRWTDGWQEGEKKEEDLLYGFIFLSLLLLHTDAAADSTAAATGKPISFFTLIHSISAMRRERERKAALRE